jgi:D-alanyl-D-alanine carboxypeptidase/D-alanyl-D-alanine-endopeptidase (penicillin-binding protein 4)
MKKLFFVTSSWLLGAGSFAQNITPQLQKAYQQFETDPQLKHAISSLYVIDAKTGKIIFDRNSQVGLAPASTQKVITSVTAFELLGKDYRYKTYIGYDIGIEKGELKGNLYIEGNGDPTLGSKRWESTKDSNVLKYILILLKRNGIKKIKGDIWIDNLQFGINPLPDGWIWQDIGNYYGAGASGLNWCENQYDLILQPGQVAGQMTAVVKTDPPLFNYQLGNFIKTGKKESGDNGYIYFAPYSSTGFATGTIPAGTTSFSISGSIPNPSRQFGYSLRQLLKKENIPFSNNIKLYSDSVFEGRGIRKMMLVLDSIVSPPLDSINYWFLKKSINLYGEALIKTFSQKKYYSGSTDSGAAIVKNFWKQKNLDEDELNIYDGSGLSPLNRVTAHAQVEVLKYAKTKDWFPYFYDALPEYNGMKIKSGTISDVKAFCGYHKAKDGNEYIFSFLVNNYNGSSAALVNKMYKVLDVLK